ncbi:type II toxin-antitoxin system Phd/YefM family antitoxin [Candidatus Shapirobacteria bacterium]|nr:type II toxin-antitoxin system Phd/YefM family antitoxin [Candidatus Shapirobacteria bacterium]
MYRQLINNEEFTSIQEAQAGLTSLLARASKKKNFYRVMRNNKPVGVLIPDDLWLSFLEDLEALSSPAYLKSIERARRSKKRYSAKEVKKALDILDI